MIESRARVGCLKQQYWNENRAETKVGGDRRLEEKIGNKRGLFCFSLSKL